MLSSCAYYLDRKLPPDECTGCIHSTKSNKKIIEDKYQNKIKRIPLLQRGIATDLELIDYDNLTNYEIAAIESSLMATKKCVSMIKRNQLKNNI